MFLVQMYLSPATFALFALSNPYQQSTMDCSAGAAATKGVSAYAFRLPGSH